MQPTTHYAKSGDVHIAYQVVGDGPIDLVYVQGWVSHLEHAWEYPPLARCLRRLASFSRLIRLDKRGTGLSDRTPELPTLEQRMDDVRAVLDAVGSERAVLFGSSEGGAMCGLFAATYPERTAALVLYGSFAKGTTAPDYPRGVFSPEPAEREQFFERVARDWGTSSNVTLAPGHDADRRFQEWWATDQRLSASPGAAVALLRLNADVDWRHVLPSIRVPTLIVHRTGDPASPVWGGRYLAERIPAARYVELPGDDHPLWTGDSDAILDEIQAFLTGTHRIAEPDRVLATVLFSDIVGSTEHAARLGDRRWLELLEDHDRLVRTQLERARGRAIKHTGDGFLATFDGPARAVRCAEAIRDVVRQLGIEVRAGLHTGECEFSGDDIGGLAVHIGQRVSALAAPNEVLVSSTVKDLVVGSGLRFEDRGTHALKGVPDAWRLFRVIA
jgi:class 3 adenylate cyclase